MSIQNLLGAIGVVKKRGGYEVRDLATGKFHKEINPLKVEARLLDLQQLMKEKVEAERA